MRRLARLLLATLPVITLPAILLVACEASSTATSDEQAELPDHTAVAKLSPQPVGSLVDGQTFVSSGDTKAEGSLAADSTANADESTVYLTTRPGVLQPGVRYGVRVRYRVKSQPADRAHFLYLTVRGGKWFPLIELPTIGEPIQENGFEFLTPDDGKDYHIEIGRRGSGEALIDAVVIEKLPRLAEARKAKTDVSGSTIPEFELPYEPYGMCVHADRLWQYTDEQVERAVPMWAEAGIQWVRIGMGWVAFEPHEEGGWDQAQIARMDRLLALCEEYGVKPYAIVGGTPRWASTQPDHPRHWAFRARDQDRFRAFVQFAARRYGSQIQVWELGNEPNWGFWLDDMPSYMRRARAAAEIIRQEVPGAIILNGGWADAGLLGMRLGNIVPRPDAMREVAAEGFDEVFDVMAVHVYGDDPEEMIYRLNQYYAQMHELGLGHMPMWVTETGFSTVGGRTEDQQAEWVRQTYDLLLQHPCVEKVFYYNFRMKVSEAKHDEREAGFGVVDGDLKPRPSYEAFRTMPKRTTPVHDPTLLAVDRWRLRSSDASSTGEAGN